MFTGLSAFPLTPFKDEKVDYSGFESLITNLTSAKVDSICAMGSTGLYPYLNRSELSTLAKTTVELSGDIPVMVGIGALRTYDVLKNAETAQQASVDALLLAPMSYHPLSEQEVLALFETVTAEIEVPLVVYDNPGVTNFTFSDDLYYRVTRLPNIGAIKIPGMPFATDEGPARLAQLRNIVPESVAIGVSGDKFGAAGMAAGCDLWLSVIGGLFPNTVKQLIRSAHTKQENPLNSRLEELWQLFVRNKGGLRVIATAANILGYADNDCLPAPLQPLTGEDRNILEKLLSDLKLD